MGDETVQQKKEVVQGARALGSLGQKWVSRIKGWILSPMADLTTAGRYVAAASAVLAALCLGLILFDASSAGLEKETMAVVDTLKANIRSSPTTRAGIVTQAESGDRFEVVQTEEKWTSIRSADGKVSGWIASSLIRTKTVTSFVYRYDLKGYFLLFLCSAAAIILAFRFGRKGEKRGSWFSHP